MYTSVVKNIIFPLHEKLKGHKSREYLKDLEYSQWWDAGKLESYKIKKLQNFISYISAHVPYYNKILDELGLSPKDFTSLTDIQKLSLTDKKFMRENSEQLISLRNETLQKFNTGGSTGEPLIFYLSKERVSHDIAAKWRATRWWGVDIGDPEIVVWGSPIELGTQDVVKKIRDKVLRTTLLPAFEMTTERIRDFISTIKKQKPKMLFGYPSSIALIAKQALKDNMAVDCLGIKVVFVTSERLYDDAREVIEKAFNCKVANGYGGRDSGFIAHECELGGMHITAENLIVEIVDEQGAVLPPGESGEIVVTNFATRAFPFVRYRTGDLGAIAKHPCACGRCLPLLQEIQGRTTDFLTAINGASVHALGLIYVMREIPEISMFKIIQETADRVRVLVCVDGVLPEKNIRQIYTDFKSRLGDEMLIELEHVTEISQEKSGKFKHVVNRLQT